MSTISLAFFVVLVAPNAEVESVQLARVSRYCIAQQDYDAGTRWLQEAIMKNPQDVGCGYLASTTDELSVDAMRHGQVQVRRLLKDRPVLAPYLEEGNDLWIWAVKRFADDGGGRTVIWDPATPSSQADAEHEQRGFGASPLIRVSAVRVTGPQRGDPHAFEPTWCFLVFELYNVASSRKVMELESQVVAGKVSTKEEYVFRKFSAELEAVQFTRAYYAQRMLPWAKSRRFVTTPELWYTTDAFWGTPRQCFLRYTDKDSYPWSSYGPHFDRLQAMSSFLRWFGVRPMPPL